jgi:Rod binding domain-containing protein
MDASALNVQGAAMLAQSAQTKAPAATTNAEVAAKTSKEFESVFISQFLGSMFQGISTDGPTGGGQGEEMFRSLMIDQYGKSIEQRGGFGLATAVQRQLLKHQEVPAPASATSATASPAPASLN